MDLDLRNIAQVLPILRTRLQPLEHAHTLVDRQEGDLSAARRAAVLLALFAQAGETHLIFIRRAATLRTHSGEIAFPGGSYEQTDSSLVITALREASEEIGLSPARAEALGLLEPVSAQVSNFLIVPVVAYLPNGPGPLLAQADEVADIFLLPLHALADPTIAHIEIWQSGGRARTLHFYDYGSLCIWGATGRILTNLLALLNEKQVTHKS